MTTTYQPMTPREYLVRERRAEYKSEYYDGEVVAMSGASRKHVLVVGNFLVALGTRLRGRPCETYSSDMRVKLPEGDRYVYPDLAVVCGGPRFLDGELDTLLNPVLLVEVLSPSTEANDRGRKAANYRQIQTVREYLLVSQDEARIELYRREEGDEWSCTLVGAGGVLELASLGLAVPIEELYERVFQPFGRRVPARDTDSGD